jgi:hypothetical protein
MILDKRITKFTNSDNSNTIIEYLFIQKFDDTKYTKNEFLITKKINEAITFIDIGCDGYVINDNENGTINVGNDESNYDLPLKINGLNVSHVGKLPNAVNDIVFAENLVPSFLKPTLEYYISEKYPFDEAHFSEVINDAENGNWFKSYDEEKDMNEKTLKIVSLIKRFIN